MINGQLSVAEVGTRLSDGQLVIRETGPVGDSAGECDKSVVIGLDCLLKRIHYKGSWHGIMGIRHLE